MKKSISVLIILALVFSILTGCATTATTTAATTKAATTAAGSTAAATTAAATTAAATTKAASSLPAYKIGMITQLTGDNSFGGYEYKYGAELAIEHLGGAINGRKIEMAIADGPNQDTTLSEFERLYNNGVRSFVSGYGSVADPTFATMADKLKAVYLSLSWNRDLIQGKSDYFFRAGANVDDFSTAVIKNTLSVGKDYLKKDAKDLKIAIVYKNTLEYMMPAVKDAVAKFGANIVMQDSYPADTKDFVPLITKLMNTQYDILIPFQGAADGTPFQKKMKEMKYTPNVTIGAGIVYDTPVFGQLGNDITDGIMSVSFPNPGMSSSAAAGIEKFKTEFNKKYGHYPLTHALQAYGVVFTLAEALKKIEPSQWDDSAKVAAAVKSLDIDYGKLPWYWGVKFNDNNTNTKADVMLVCQWVGGELRTVYPKGLMVQDPVIPWVKK